MSSCQLQQIDSLLIGWTLILWIGILLVNVGRKETTFDASESSATSSDEVMETPKGKRSFYVYDGDKMSKVMNATSHIESINRIFGASKTSFRYNNENKNA